MYVGTFNPELDPLQICPVITLIIVTLAKKLFKNDQSCSYQKQANGVAEYSHRLK
jgi:hypothetical protein